MHTDVDSIRPARRSPAGSLLTRALVLTGLVAGTLALAPDAPRVRAAHQAAPTTVTIWDIQTGIQQQQLNDQAAAFNKTHPSIHVQYQWFQNDPYKTKLGISIGAHQGPDIFMGWGGGILQSYVNSGAVTDLTSALGADSAWKNRYTPSTLGPVTFGGHIYGVPYNATTPEVVFYNKDMFKQYGLSVPTTWPQMEQVIKTLQGHNVIPFALAGKSEWPEMIIMQYLADRIGGQNALNDIALHKAGATFDSPAWIDAATMAQSLVKENAFESGFASFNYDTGDAGQLLYSGRAAMMFMGVWQIGDAKSKSPAFVPKMGFFPVPAVPGGKGDVNDIVGVPANYYSILSSSPHKAAAIEYLKDTLNPAYSAQLLALGEVPPVQKLDISKVTDPLVKAQVALLAKAPSYQLALDQLLPPQLAQTFLDLTGSLFAQTITPQQFASRMQAKTTAYVASHK